MYSLSKSAQSCLLLQHSPVSRSSFNKRTIFGHGYAPCDDLYNCYNIVSVRGIYYIHRINCNWFIFRIWRERLCAVPSLWRQGVRVPLRGPLLRGLQGKSFSNLHFYLLLVVVVIVKAAKSERIIEQPLTGQCNKIYCNIAMATSVGTSVFSVVMAAVMSLSNVPWFTFLALNVSCQCRG